MKRMIALTLAALLVMGTFAACTKGGETDVTTTVPTTEAVKLDANTILSSIWGKFTEDELFPVTGGAPETYGEMIEQDENYTMPDAPANYDMKYAESLSTYLCIPADQLANIDEVSYAQHAMMINNLACGVVHVTSDAKTFADAVHEAIANNMWFCGQPEKLLIAVIGDEHVLISYGLEVALNPVATHLAEVYPDAQVLYNEAIG